MDNSSAGFAMAPSTRALFTGTLALGGGVVAWASYAAAGSQQLGVLALLAAAVLVTELIQVPSDPEAVDPVDAHPFSFSSSVHLATAITLGPAAAALVAAFGVVVVDSLRRAGRKQIAFNASVFAAAAAASGAAFAAVGGTPGRLHLPGDYGSVLALALVYFAVNTLLVNAMIASGSAAALRPLVLGAVRHGLPTAAGEAGLGVALALRALFEPWGVVALAPLVLAVYSAHARLALLRRETGRALETFANVVDERDTATFRHSERVAELVAALAQALRLPADEVARVRWAGRLHDLGKIAVDSSVLRKPSRLDEDEWRAMRRHPRLSARLLRPFRLAAGEAQAAEYHHERWDGCGYYGLTADTIPLAAHLLIVADAFDAMTSDRAYRAGLPPEVALAEIERGAGTQFHPLVARAFVALQRGEDPLRALTEDELQQLLSKRALGSRRRPALSLARLLVRRREVAVVVALASALTAYALHDQLAATLCAVIALALFLVGVADNRRARQLQAAVAAVLAVGTVRERVEALARVLGPSGLQWAALTRWNEQDLTGAVEVEAGERGLREEVLSGWLLREAESGDVLTVAPAHELGHSGELAALRLRDGETLTGYVVLLFTSHVPRHVEQALAACGPILEQQLSPERPGLRPPALVAA